MKYTEVKLGDVVQIINGGAWSQEEYVDSGIPVVRVSDINDGRIDLSNCKYLSPQSFDKYKKHLLFEGDLILSTVGSHKTQESSVVGKPAVVRKTEAGSLLNQNAIKIVPSDKRIHREYLRWIGFSGGFRDYITERARGSANQARIAISEIRGYNFLLPDISTQINISSLLNAIDDKIELNRRMNETFEQMTMALYKQWFSDGEDEQKLSDFVDINPLIRLKKDALTLFVDMKALPIDSMSVSDDDIITKPFTSGSKFLKDDVLFARITPCLENGKTAFVDFLEEGEAGFGSTEFLVFRAKDSCCPQYVYCLSRDREFRAYAIKSMVGTSGRQRVQTSSISEFPVAKPDTELMQRFDITTKDWFDQIRSNTKEISELKKIRDYLLPRLLSGEIEVRAALEQAEEVLAGG